MTKLLGVKIEHPDKRFTELIEVGSATSGRTRLTTLTPQQDVAEIEIYLLRRMRDAALPLSEVKKLHRFTRRRMRRDDETRPLFELSALRRGRRKYEIQLHEDGILQETVTVRVPRSSSAVAAWVLLLLVLLGVGIGVRALLKPAEPTRPVRSETESIRRTGTEDGAAARRSEATRNDTERDNTRASEVTSDGVGTGARASTVAGDEAGSTGTEAGTSDGTETTTPDKATSQSAVADPAPQDPPAQDPPLEAVEPDVQTETIYFLPDSIHLTREAARTLDTFLSRIQGAEIVEVRVEGHTALYGNEAGRERISRGRIGAILSYLERNGWRPETLPENGSVWCPGAGHPRNEPATPEPSRGDSGYIPAG